MNRKIEILAPAGSIESLKAAVSAGADAVYMGGHKFGARAYAKNPEEEQLLGAIDYAHIHGCKLYLTVNTLLKDCEIGELYEYLLPYYLHGLDAIIVQDVGVLTYVRHYFPNLPVHASTQMTITGTHGARLMKEYGVERIVPARELSLAEVKDMKTNTGLEIECFVHGALCYCYSGQCLFSSLIGGRSGNRGHCAQPCRLEFEADKRKSGTLLSLKDLCTIEMIPQLIDAGIDSFKIEGRMKQPDYVYTVVQLYKKYTQQYLDNMGKPFIVSDMDKNRLLSVYKRRGYTDGYYNRHNGKDMISFSRPKVEHNEQQVELNYKIQEKINGKLILLPQRNAKLSLSYSGITVECDGAITQEALKQPLTCERVEAQMRKTGTTEFQFERLDIDIKGNVFLPMQSLNELRREALETLTEKVLSEHRRRIENVSADEPLQASGGGERESTRTVIAAYATTMEQLRAIKETPEVTVVYIDDSLGFQPTDAVKEQLHMIRQDQREIILAMPHIFRQNAVKMWERGYKKVDPLYDGLLVRNYEGLGWLMEHDYVKKMVPDHNLYVFNQYAKLFLKRTGLTSFTAAMELNYKELSQLMITDGCMVVYGYMPMMVTANCMEQTIEGCSHNEKNHVLKDRYRKEFIVKNNCRYCYNLIYNSAPLMLLNQKEQIAKLNPIELRLDFTTESGAETVNIISLYLDVFLYNKEIEMPDVQFTKGHFKRGVK